ncbi:hypothetical protein JZX86_25800 [Agrobacterium rosae]|uniref:hypothetical protein n=1 Tax=Agrobacterium rosae TaxID=1972867 RepID=UPI0019D3F1A3|nr:hypothetical protein [Agrobacterium rosae]MBN7808747.1 hypothetical protein [Agrobacterium rosae]
MVEDDLNGQDRRKSDLVSNERRKLLANALDRLSTAFIAIGVLGPALSLTPNSLNISSVAFIVGWILSSVALHLTARRVLGGLRI